MQTDCMYKNRYELSHAEKTLLFCRQSVCTKIMMNVGEYAVILQTDCMRENHYEPQQAREDVFILQAAQAQSAVVHETECEPT